MLPVNSAANFSVFLKKICYMVMLRDSRLTTNVEGHEVEGQDQDIKTRSVAC